MSKKFLKIEYSGEWININPLKVKTWNDDPKTFFIKSEVCLCPCSNKKKERKPKKQANFTENQMVQVLYPNNSKTNFSNYVKLQKTPDEMRYKQNEIETYIERNEKIKSNYGLLESPRTSFDHREAVDVFAVNSSTYNLSSTRLVNASPSPSTIFEPSRQLLKAKAPRSGIFINEVGVEGDTTIPYETYNPRKLQEEINDPSNQFLVFEKNGQLYAMVDKEGERKEQFAQAEMEHRAFLRCTLTELQSLDGNKMQIQNRSLAISIIAFLFSKISHPKYWTRRNLDEIVFMGTKLHESQKKTVLHIDDMPRVISIGLYKMNFMVQRAFYTGTVAVRHVFTCSDCFIGISKLFETFNGGVVQLKDKYFGIWKNDDLYLLIDPFMRSETGEILTDKAVEGSAASLYLSNKLATIIDSIYNLLNKFGKDEEFMVHAIKLMDVEYIDAKKIMERRKVNKSGKSEYTKPFCYVPLDDRSISSKTSFGPTVRELMRTDAGADRTAELIGGITADKVIDSIFDKAWRKSVKEGRETELFTKAKRVTPRSDIAHLLKQYENVVHGEDYDNIDEALQKHKREPLPITLSKELAIPSNFRDMPDGSAIITGYRNLMQSTRFNESFPIAASTIAVAMSYRYSIQSWTRSLVSGILTIVNDLQKVFPLGRYDLFEAPTHHYPDIKFSSKKLSITSNVKWMGKYAQFNENLERLLLTYNRLVCSTMSFSAAIFHRNNFYYLFDPLPCDSVGIRWPDIQYGLASFARFDNIYSLMNRIHCNRNSRDPNQMISISIVSVLDVSGDPPTRYKKRTASQEEIQIEHAIEDKKKTEMRNEDKLHFLLKEMDDEDERLEKYGKQEDYDESTELREMIKDEFREDGEEDGGRRQRPGVLRDKECISDDEEESVMSERMLESLEKKFQAMHGWLWDEELKCALIEGTASLKKRFQAFYKQIRTCHFSSMYALLLVINHPFNEWNFRKVDICIEQGTRIFRMTDKHQIAANRHIEKILVDRFYYDVEIVEIKDEMNDEPKFNKLLERLEKFFKTHKYLLLQFSNITFGIKRIDTDDHTAYAIFDSYPFDISFSNKRTSGPYKNAGWVLKDNINELIYYIKQRVLDPNDFILYLAMVRKIYDAPKKAQFANKMITYSPIIHEKYKKKEIVFDEQVEWTDKKEGQMLPWSRMRNELTPYLFREFYMDIPDVLHSLWGNIHPSSNIFKIDSRGKQFLAINCIACAMAEMYLIDEWTRRLIDTIVLYGDVYFRQKISNIYNEQYEVTLDDFCGWTEMFGFRILMRPKAIILGKLYNYESNGFNLAQALVRFFELFKSGIIQCHRKSLAFGRSNNKYFMFDCQSMGPPLFRKKEGCAYVLRVNDINELLSVMIQTLNIPYYNIEFTLYNVRIEVKLASHLLQDDENDDN